MKIKFFLTLIATLLFVGCSENHKIEKTAQKFLDSYFSQNLRDAKSYAAEKTAADIDYFLSQAEIEPLSKSEAPIVEINDILICEDSAYCRYTLKQNLDDASAMSENLTLIKENGEWKVLF